MELSIIIVNYNSFDLIKQCISSANKYLSNVIFEIIVVDSYSEEKDINQIESMFTNVKLISLNENKGFGYANNAAALSAKGNLLLFLNPDTYFIDSSILEAIKFYNTSKYGIVAPFLLNPDLSIQYCHDNFHSYLFLASEAFNLHNFHIKKVLREDSKRINKEPFEIDWALGAAILINRDIFMAAGMFDDRMFLYYEDADLAKKVVNLGYANYCYAKSSIIHHLSATSGDKIFSKYHVHKSRTIYISKYFNGIKLFTLRYLFIFSLMLKILFFAVIFKLNYRRLKYSLDAIKMYLFL